LAGQVIISFLGFSMRRSRSGLQGKILLIMSAVVVTVVAVSTGIAMVLTRRLVAEKIYRQALAKAKLMAHQLVNERALNNPPMLLQAMRQMMHDFPSVKQADVYLHEPVDHLVATTNPAGQHLELDRLPGVQHYNEYELVRPDQITIETPIGKFWIMGTPISEHGRVVGCLNLKVSKSQLNAITRGLVLRNLLLTLASLGALALFIHLFFLERVRTPVRGMIRVMESAEAGQLSVRAREGSRDEIGELAGHLNRMLERIANFNAELERQVEGATAELAQRNEQLKRINEELFETQKTLARSERLGLAHEIGTPLNSISGHVQLLARQGVSSPSSLRRLQVIERQIDSIVRTVKQLLSWTRKFDLKLEPVSLRHLLEESLLLSSPTLQHRRIEVATDWPADCPPVYADAGYLQQVFLNLINNSLDAMPRGGRLSIRLRAPEPENGREVTLQFEDTGSGIGPENLRHIFEPMFTTKRLGTGAGLGLAICDQIIRQHGGSISVESEVGRGTRFTVTLPLDARETTERPPAEAEETTVKAQA
jgi:two-component system NtrC family sensor kinase